MSKIIILIGTEGSGKTYLAKQLVKKVNRNALFVFDVNNEWKTEYPYPFDKSIDNFLDKFETVKKGVGVFEDATCFFSTRGRDGKLVEQMTGRRHTGNSFILLFHSFQDVPKYILRKATDVVIFKTKDMPGYMIQEFKNTIYLPAWERVMNEAKTCKFFSCYPPPKGSIPPSEHIKQ